MIEITLALLAAAAFAYEVYLCSEIEKRLTRIEKLVEKMDGIPV